MQAGTSALIEVLTNCERILRTPIPLAYNIAIALTGTPSPSLPSPPHPAPTTPLPPTPGAPRVPFTTPAQERNRYSSYELYDKLALLEKIQTAREVRKKRHVGEIVSALPFAPGAEMGR